jgi:hypothetical protein
MLVRIIRGVAGAQVEHPGIKGQLAVLGRFASDSRRSLAHIVPRCLVSRVRRSAGRWRQ